MQITGAVGLMIAGFAGLVAGFLIPFLTMIKVLEAGFVLLFASYLMSVGGLVIGVLGSALFVRGREH
jgi:uncharacterized protein YacL